MAEGLEGALPSFPPPEQDDINALPLEMPPHMQVRSYFSLFKIILLKQIVFYLEF